MSIFHISLLVVSLSVKTLCVYVFVARVWLWSEFHHQEDSSTHSIKRMVWWCQPLTWRRWFLSGTGDYTNTKSPFTFLMLIKHALAFHSCLHMFNLGSRIKCHLCFRCSPNSRLINRLTGDCSGLSTQHWDSPPDCTSAPHTHQSDAGAKASSHWLSAPGWCLGLYKSATVHREFFFFSHHWFLILKSATK